MPIVLKSAFMFSYSNNEKYKTKYWNI